MRIIGPCSGLPLPKGALALVPLAAGIGAAHAQCGFEIIASPNGGTLDNFLFGVAAVSDDEVWAVGRYGVFTPPSDTADFPLGLRWDGAAWSVVPMPMLDEPVNGFHFDLYDVHAFGTDDVWAVGDHVPPSGGAIESLAYHWGGDGWEIIPSPEAAPGVSGGSRLRHIDGVSGDDFWAVGFINNRGYVTSSTFLAAHWDGSGWTEHVIPPIGTGWNELSAVHVIDSDNAWALGGTGIISPNNPYVFSWDGSSWSEAADRLDPFDHEGAYDIIAFAQDDVWIATGLVSPAYRPIFYHWDGSSWTPHELPDPYHQANFVGGDPDDFYSVGGPSALHWNGTSWELAAQLETYPFGAIWDADRLADGTVWAAGGTTVDDSTLTATFRVCDGCPADLAEPFGVLDLADVQAFIAGFTAQDPIADLDGNGVWDLADVQGFIASFSAGCS